MMTLRLRYVFLYNATALSNSNTSAVFSAHHLQDRRSETSIVETRSASNLTLLIQG
jgi:hypothetical protein